MSIQSILFAAAALAVAATGSAALADPVDLSRVSGPAAHQNLSVYFVHGDRGGGVAPLTLEQAMANGAVKIHETDRHPVQIENVSSQSVFIQLGDLIRGGLQDQVAGISMLLPPHSGLTNLLTFCVDPFRSSARDGENPKLFSPTGALFPWRLAKLGILAGGSDTKVTPGIREAAVWWSIDTVRSELAQTLGEPIESPKVAHWGDNATDRANTALASRRSPWTTSLPLALENQRLLQAQHEFTDAFERVGQQAGDVVGAVFAIDGQVIGADVYQSHALFLQMWPKLLRAYATEALASTAASTAPPLSVQDVSMFLAAGRQGALREQAAGTHDVIRDGDAAIFAETVGSNGQWVYRSIVPKLGAAVVPYAPEALLVRMLESGEVDGRSLASLGADEAIQVARNGDDWATTIESSRKPFSPLPRYGNSNASGFGDVVLVLTWIGILLMIFRAVIKSLIRLGVALVRRSFRVVDVAGRATARLARQGAVSVAAVARGMLQNLDPARLALPFASVRYAVAGAARRSYVRRMPAVAAVSIAALAIGHHVATFW